MKTGAELIAEERARQIAVEGWTAQHDDGHDKGELSRAGLAYLIADTCGYVTAGDPPACWPWRKSWWKPAGPLRNAVKAGALIRAERERLDRLEKQIEGGIDRLQNVAAAASGQKYLWTEQDSDEMSGVFNSIDEAIADAAKIATEREDPLTIEVFDSRPATEADREMFEGSEDVDIDEPDWWKCCVVQENVVRTHTFPKPVLPLFPTCEAVGPCPRPTFQAAPYHHFYWDAERDESRMNQIHNHGGGHDEPLSNYGAVICKTCGKRALVLSDADDFPQI